MARRPYNGMGMDPSPLLPLAVFLGVVVLVATPLMFQLIPLAFHMMPMFFLDTRATTLTGAPVSSSSLWVIPLILITVLIFSSSFSDAFSTSPSAYKHPVYRYQNHPYNEGTSWGFLFLMLCILLLLPWR